jgi:hypothetical protein
MSISLSISLLLVLLLVLLLPKSTFEPSGTNYIHISPHNKFSFISFPLPSSSSST